jgi:hypothetical protein
MVLLSGLIGLPFALSKRRAPKAQAAVQVLAGATSLVLGLTLLWDLQVE